MNTRENLSFLPTQMTRTSPFFIMSRRQMQNRPTDRIMMKNSWGRITIEGERLSVNDETNLLFLLTAAKRKRHKELLVTRYLLCNLVGVHHHTDTYKAIWNSIKRLSNTYILIENKELNVEIDGTIISTMLRVRRGGNELMNLQFHPYFFQMDKENLITRLDLAYRSKLKGDVSKALYRFFNGQRDFYSRRAEFGCYLSTLCEAINLNTAGVPLWRLRHRVKAGLDALERAGYLEGQITHNDYVNVNRIIPTTRELRRLY